MPEDVLVDYEAMTKFLHGWFDARTRQEHMHGLGAEHPFPVDELDDLLRPVVESMRGPDGRRIHFISL